MHTKHWPKRKGWECRSFEKKYIMYSNLLFLNPTRVWFGPKLYPHQPGQHKWQIQTLCKRNTKICNNCISGCWHLIRISLYSSVRAVGLSLSAASQRDFLALHRARLPHLERLVTGSRITMHSFTSPYLQKYSFRPSENKDKEIHIVACINFPLEIWKCVTFSCLMRVDRVPSFLNFPLEILYHKGTVSISNQSLYFLSYQY